MDNTDNLKRKGKGRPPGSQNKVTLAVKVAFQTVFDDIGGADAFGKWARQKRNQTEFYKLYSKLLPMDLNHSGEIKLPAIVELPPKKKRD